MPDRLLPVPHFRQSSEASCLAACAPIVLAHAGDERLETELVRLFDIDPGCLHQTVPYHRFRLAARVLRAILRRDGHDDS